MFRYHSTLAVGLLLAFSGVAGAETEVITLGKHEAHPTRILARYAPGVNAQAHAGTLQALGVGVKRQFQTVPGLVVLDEAAGRMQMAGAAGEPFDPIASKERLLARMAALERTGLFEYVAPSYVHRRMVAPNDSRFTDGTLWGLRNTGAGGGVAGADIDAVRAWDVTTGSTNVIVAVIDSGIRFSHRDLAVQMWRNPGETINGRDSDDDGYVDNIHGINAINGSGNPFDDNGHGTHVAGTIGAAANDGNPHVGVAWNVQLMACKFLNALGFGFTDNAIECIDFAVLKGARILNNSWGGGPFERALFDSIAAARSQGVLFIVAAGNEENNNDRFPAYPASYRLDNVISVAALDRRDRLGTFSNFGSTNVHLGAPGVSIFSTVASSDSAYDTFDGTSMAAPHVSGVAALILANSPEALLPEIRTRLLTTTVPVPALQGLSRTGGRVNAYRALTASPDGILEVSVDPAPGADLLAGGTIPIFVTVSDLAPVTNAVVTATIEGTGETLTFRNDGVAPDEAARDGVYSVDLDVPNVIGPLTLDLSVTAPGKTNYNETIVYTVIAPPVNDAFADALKLASGGTVLQATNRLATMEPGEPFHARIPTVSASIWFVWSPESSGNAIVDTAGSSFDTVLAVYTNSTLSTLKEVASVDDVGRKLQGYVLFDAVKGTSYRIAVAGYERGQEGTVRLRVEPGGQPDTNAPNVQISTPLSGTIVTNASARVVIRGTANDPQPNASGVKEVLVQVNNEIALAAAGTTNWASTNLLQAGVNTIRVVASDFAGNISAPRTITVNYRPVTLANDHFHNAAELSGLAGAVEADTTGASKEFGEPLHAGNDGGKSVWWRFTAPESGILSLSTTNSTFDTLLAVYSGTRVDQLQVVASNDDAFDGVSWSRVSQAVQAGLDYRIAVDGFAGASGMAHLQYSFTPETVYQLTVSSTPGGDVSPGSGFFPSGSNVQLHARAEPNFRFERWEGITQSTANPLVLLIDENKTVRAVFGPVPFADDFETGKLQNLNWTVGGDAGWFVQSTVISSGSYAVRSGVIGNSQSSSLFLVDTFRAGPAAFDLRVSSEPGWDVLELYLNNRLVRQWSGEVPWQRFAFEMPSGTSVLEWRYKKDHNQSIGLDAAFIDNLTLPFGVAKGPSTPARLSLSQNATGMQLVVEGQAGQEYVVEFSENLSQWQPLSTQVATGGRIEISEPKPAGNRFYRAVVP